VEVHHRNPETWRHCGPLHRPFRRHRPPRAGRRGRRDRSHDVTGWRECRDPWRQSDSHLRKRSRPEQRVRRARTRSIYTRARRQLFTRDRRSGIPTGVDTLRGSGDRARRAASLAWARTDVHGIDGHRSAAQRVAQACH